MNYQVLETLIITSSVIRFVHVHGYTLTTSFTQNLTKETYSWVRDNYGKPDYEKRKENFINQKTLETKSI